MSIGSRVTSIGDFAFDGCTSLLSVFIPDSLTFISETAFVDCANLKNINVGSGNSAYASLDGVLFDNTLESLIQFPLGRDGHYIIPDSVTSVRWGAFSRCINLTGVVIPDNVTSIGRVAFYGCTSLNDVYISNSIASIEEGTFFGCTSLTSVSIPGSVISVETQAFYNCTGLISVAIGNSVTSIGILAFSGCSSLTSVSIPDGVTTLGDQAFSFCGSLNSVFFGNGIHLIEGSALIGCGNLESVYFMGIPPSDPYGIFEGSNLVTVFYIDGTPGWEETYAGRPTATFDPDWVAALEGSLSPWYWQSGIGNWLYIDDSTVAATGQGWIFVPKY